MGRFGGQGLGFHLRDQSLAARGIADRLQDVRVERACRPVPGAHQIDRLFLVQRAVRPGLRGPAARPSAPPSRARQPRIER